MYYVGVGTACLVLGVATGAYILQKKVLNKDATLQDLVTLTKDYAIFRLREFVSDRLEVGKVEVVGRTTTITYFKGNVKYKIKAPTKRGIRVIKTIHLKSVYDGIVSEGDKELTKRIEEFAGPYCDFHSIPTSPHLLGINQPLVITYSNNVTVVYGENDIISTVLPT